MVGERALITTLIFLSLENHCNFLLAKKKNSWKHIFNTNCELSQNRTEKQITPSKSKTFVSSILLYYH